MMARNKYKRTTLGKRRTLERKVQRRAKVTAQDLDQFRVYR